MLLAACATRPLESPELRTEVPLFAVTLFDKDNNPSDPDLMVRKREQADILALSGGGADGAFGAGVLVGWSERGDRPKFDIVTGVSTGALMATLAFVGPSQDAALTRLYTSQTDDKIYRDKGLGGVLSDSLYDYAPLKKQIEEVVSAELLDKVAAEHETGRRLYVATTNLDAGKLVVWDMGAIAASGRYNRVRVFQKVLRASAAVPGFFQPVYIKPRRGIEIRQAHVDGGVKAPVLIRSFMFRIPAQQRRLHVIVNGQLSLLNAGEAVKADVGDIARKSITELLRGLLYKTLYQGYATSQNAGADFRMIAIPDRLPPTKDALKFDPARMQMLFEAGRKLGGDGSGWRNEPPRLEKLERIARSE